MRENSCSLTGQGEAWELVDLNIPLHRLGNEAKVIQMVFQSKGMTLQEILALTVTAVKLTTERKALWRWGGRLAQPQEGTTLCFLEGSWAFE